MYLEGLLLSEIRKATEVVMPDETECHMYAEQFLVGVNVIFDSVKLRYDKKQTESVSVVNAPEVNTAEALAMMKIALIEADKSPDWWIQVGGVLARNGEVRLVGHNEHKPNEREALFMGDPRSNFSRGLQIELNLVDHAERVIIGEAARRRIGTEGCDLYVTTFPCPPCSRQIIRTGIKRCFFLKGYALMEESDKNMRAEGIEIFHVKI
jgi:dCMP deaminase